MKTTMLLSAWITLLLTVSVHADDDLVGKNIETGPAGAPACIEQAQLQEYMMALIQKDEKWRESLDSCMFLNGGTKIAVIEDLPGSEIGHVIKGRVFGPKGSAIAYLLSIGLVEKK